MAARGDRFRMCLVANGLVFAELMLRRGCVLDGTQSVLVLDGTQAVAGFVWDGTQYRPPSLAVANDAATRTATAPIVAALKIC